MASCGSPDTFSWLQDLPPLSQWKTNSMSMCICSSNSSHPSLNFSLNRISISSNISSNTFTFSIVADFRFPISLLISEPFKIVCSGTSRLLNQDDISTFLIKFVDVVLKYGVRRNSLSVRIPKLDSNSNFRDIFNLAFHTFVFLVCIYEAPTSLRTTCLNTIKNYLITCRSRQGLKMLMVQLGSNLEEQWMRSLNLAITNWIVEIRAAQQRPLIKSPSPLFSYAFSTQGLWKVHLYCPIIAMEVENLSNNVLNDERLFFSLNYHLLEGVIQFNYKVLVHEKWINIMVNTDNIRCDIVRLVNETLLSERGVGAEEKHFPSRISLQLTPTLQTNILTVSVSKSSENPTREFEIEKNVEASLEAPNTFGFKMAAGETTSMSMRPWKFEQSVLGYSANLNWFLHDSSDGREVFSSKPSKVSMINPRAWFKHRYSNVFRPFTKEGGVVFAGDSYGESVFWKVDKSAMAGKVMEWEIRGCIWLTYWPNKYHTFYNETRKLEFKETVYLNLPQI